MSIPYNTGVPAATNNPSVDQPTMLINTANIATYVAVDHVPFNTSGSGLHNKVSLVQQNADPASATSTPIIYSRPVTYSGGVNRTEEFERMATADGATIMSATNFFNPPVTASTGSSFLPGIPVLSMGTYTTAGAVIKWGDCGTVTSGGTPVTFVNAFPTNCFLVLVSATQTGSAASKTYSVDQTTVTKSGFTAYASGNVNLRYIAIGN
jgi:hypothetical protein